MKKATLKKLGICLGGTLLIINTVICAELLIGKIVSDQTQTEQLAENDPDEYKNVDETPELVDEDRNSPEDEVDKIGTGEASSVKPSTGTEHDIVTEKPQSESDISQTDLASSEQPLSYTSGSTDDQMQNQVGIVAGINDCGADEATMGAINTYLAAVPDKIAALFVNSGWTVHVVESADGRAFVDYKTRSIMIEAGKADRQDVLLAMGEFIDCATGYTSYSDSFKAIYEAEAGAYIMNMDYTPLSWSDMFCDAVIKYYSMGSRLQTSCPKTYSFVAAKLAELPL